MKFEQIKKEVPERFRRLTGVKRATFDKMTEILINAEGLLKAQGGKPNKLELVLKPKMRLYIVCVTSIYS